MPHTKKNFFDVSAIESTFRFHSGNSAIVSIHASQKALNLDGRKSSFSKFGGEPNALQWHVIWICWWSQTKNVPASTSNCHQQFIISVSIVLVSSLSKPFSSLVRSLLLRKKKKIRNETKRCQIRLKRSFGFCLWRSPFNELAWWMNSYTIPFFSTLNVRRLFTHVGWRQKYWENSGKVVASVMPSSVELCFHVHWSSQSKSIQSLLRFEFLANFVKIDFCAKLESESQELVPFCAIETQRKLISNDNRQKMSIGMWLELFISISCVKTSLARLLIRSLSTIALLPGQWDCRNHQHAFIQNNKRKIFE